MTNSNTTNIKEMTLAQLEEFALSIGEQKFRAKQIFKWIYQKRVSDFSEMTNMPKTLRESLADCASINKLDAKFILESKKGDAVKFGFVAPAEGISKDNKDNNDNNKSDGYIVESVLLIDGDRRTACVSSQLGCALGCAFCETAKLGFIRNLTQGEIIGQLIGINDYLAAHESVDKKVTNIVFMGMGEALANFENFRAALSIIMHPDAFNIGARRITVSTAGVIPSVEKLMREDLTIGLAISLNAWNNDLRSEFMPVNKKYPIEELIKIAKKYHAKTGRRVTFEYVMIRDVTDTKEAAAALCKLLGNFPCKINLIPVNPAGNAKVRASSDDDVARFAAMLHAKDLAATIRKSRGQDIMGACGQLASSRL